MLKLPSKVNFDICTFCNHKCTFCSNSDKRTLKNIVSLKNFEKVMDNVTRRLDIKELGLSAKGEVLINTEIVSIINLCKQKYNIPYIYISSNGALLTKELANDILSAGLDSIKFSINAINREDYKRVHLKDDFIKVIDNLKYLIKLKKEKFPNLKIFLSSIIDKSKDEITNTFRILLGEDFKYIDNNMKYSISFTPKFEKFPQDMSKIKPCPLVFDEIYIDSDCRLGLCCKDYFKEFDFGSLLTNDFMNLYASEEFNNIRNMHLNKSFPDNHFCKKCLIFSKEMENEEK